MIRPIWHFFKLPYLLVGTFWPKPWHFFVLRTWHPCLSEKDPKGGKRNERKKIITKKPN